MLWDIAIKNLWRRKLRTVLTILGVATAVQLYLTMNSWMSIYKQDLRHQLSAFTGKIFVQQPMEASSGGKDFPSFSSSLDAETAATILSLEEIDRAASSAVLFIALARASSPNMPPAALAVGIEPGHETAYLGSFETESGNTTLGNANSVILGQAAAQRYRPKDSITPAKSGQTVEIQGRSFIVVDVLKPASILFDNSVIMPLATSQALFKRADTVSAIIATIGRTEEVDIVKKAIEARFPDLQASSEQDIASDADDMLAGQQDFFNLINATVVMVAVVVVTIVVVVAVMEQRREIGTLRAIGARRRRIFSLVIGESLTLSMLGAITALPFSVLTRWVLTLFASRKSPEVTSLLSVDLFQTWMFTIGIAIFIGVLASLLPAWQAVRVDPLEALRYE